MVQFERTPAGRRLVVSRVVDAPAERVWTILTDTERWPEWGPSVTAVESTDRRIETGTTGRIRLPGGLWVPFEITVCDGRRWDWRVVRIPATGHAVEPLDGGRCRVSFDLSPLAVGYVPVCQRALARIERLAEQPSDGAE